VVKEIDNDIPRKKEKNMNAYRKLTLAALVVTVVAVLTPNAGAQMLEERMRVTFSGPVEVPGEVLPAGSYIFEALENGRVTRILSADEKHNYATLLTVPDERLEAVEEPAVVLKESPKGAPARIQAWFYPGESVGNEFLYLKTRPNNSLASAAGAVLRETSRAAADAAKGVAVSTEFAGVQAGHIVVNSAAALAHAVKYLVS
jgi:hypothetical protein